MWKAYFVIILLISLVSYILQGLERFYEFIDIVLLALALTGLYGYAWEKRIFSQGYWKAFFFIMIIWNIIYHYFIIPPAKVTQSLQGQSPQSAATIGLIIFIPLFIAIYNYGYRRDDLW